MQAMPTIEEGAFAGAAGVSAAGVSSMLVGERHLIEPDFAVMFASIILFFGSIFASLTFGVINTGKEKNGVKMIPIILIISFIIFFGTRYLLTTLFGEMLL